MTVTFEPDRLHGTITLPPSKSDMHRSIIAAALANGESHIQNILFSEDILATLDAVKAIGAKVECAKDSVCITGGTKPTRASVNCRESGSTLRFMIPVCAALGIPATFHGAGNLPSRPITPYLTELSKNGVKFDYNNTMPFSITGQLNAGVFEIPGDISSQFVTGLLFALPTLEGTSEVRINGRLESLPYVNMTINLLKKFGIDIKPQKDGFTVPGGQVYKPVRHTAEGDMSQAAFFAVAAATGGSILCKGIDLDGAQGDKAIFDIVKSCGAVVSHPDRDCVRVTAPAAPLSPFEADATDIPDLVPVLAVLGCFCRGTSRIFGARRLRIKESDRLNSVSSALNALGGQVKVTDDGLIITGTGRLKGGQADSANDHRIAMSVAVAALGCMDTVILTDAESVNKSYPHFYEDYNNLGGKANGFNME